MLRTGVQKRNVLECGKFVVDSHSPTEYSKMFRFDPVITI